MPSHENKLTISDDGRVRGICTFRGVWRSCVVVGYSIVEGILHFAWQLYRTAQDTPVERFQNAALAALAAHVPFEAAIWFAGELALGEFHFHRLHVYRLPLSELKQVIEVNRRFPRPIEMTAISPGIPYRCNASEVYSVPGSAAALEHARRWGIEQQLLIALDGGEGSGEWLSLYRPGHQQPFSDRDLTLVRQLMPHLSESRTINRALSLTRVSSEPQFTPGNHRALTLLDGTVLHCGRWVRDSIAAQWPDWNQICLPSPLLRDLTSSGSVRVARRGESILARQFSDSLVITVKSIPLVERLSRREYEVVQLFGRGKAYKEIALRCEIAPATVRNIVQKCYRKLGINNKAELARLVSRADGGA